MFTAAIFTMSDRCSRRETEDISGAIVKEILEQSGYFSICEYKILPDTQRIITDELIVCIDTLKPDIIVTTGGTGFSTRDVTPEATQAVCSKLVPGIPELIRSEGIKKTKHAVLSRGIAGIRNATLIINLPGSPKGVKDSLDTCIDILPHSVKMLRDGGH